jgi:predicted kinase
MATAIVLYGPKAVGKSWIAEVLQTHLGVAHVDADELVGDLLAAGTPPDPVDGWLTWVRRRVVDALARHALVSVEATGAWDSDWRLADDLEVAGATVLRMWVSAPREVAMGRLAGRTSQRVPVSSEEASWTYDQATARAASRRLDARIEIGGPPDPAAVVAKLRPLIQP